MRNEVIHTERLQSDAITNTYHTNKSA